MLVRSNSIKEIMHMKTRICFILANSFRFYEIFEVISLFFIAHFCLSINLKLDVYNFLYKAKSYIFNLRKNI
jgi:hypothetical protein